jgi:UDP-N-acetylmuramate dehydrogenase
LKVKLQEPLRAHTSFKIGGPAQFFARPLVTRHLQDLVLSAKKNRIPVFVIGAGSNVLISDRGIQGLVIKFNSPFFSRFSLDGERIWAGCGLRLAELIQQAKESDLSGVEFLSGIPGTLGGAAVMNAGAWGKCIGDLIEVVEVMDSKGKINILHKSDLEFKYRESTLSKYFVLSVCLKLTKNKKERIQENIGKFMGNRLKSQDLSLPNAGCVFKNPDGGSAGRLIDMCGLKGRRIGGARISDRHANFILNEKNACANDILELMKLVKKEVRNKFNIKLEPEIKIWE